MHKMLAPFLWGSAPSWHDCITSLLYIHLANLLFYTSQRPLYTPGINNCPKRSDHKWPAFSTCVHTWHYSASWMRFLWPLVIRTHLPALHANEHVPNLCYLSPNNVVLSQCEFTDVSNVTVCARACRETSQENLNESCGASEERFCRFKESIYHVLILWRWLKTNQGEQKKQVRVLVKLQRVRGCRLRRRSFMWPRMDLRSNFLKNVDTWGTDNLWMWFGMIGSLSNLSAS